KDYDLETIFFNPEWYTFTPPRWYIFSPPLTSCAVHGLSNSFVIPFFPVFRLRPSLPFLWPWVRKAPGVRA
ncbi:MAG: hypothetical protein COV66_05465, partial [Nitrospinae bacterium CG11_big_fil_rev_8_21_14_0_20_45_15]